MIDDHQEEQGTTYCCIIRRMKMSITFQKLAPTQQKTTATTCVSHVSPHFIIDNTYDTQSPNLSVGERGRGGGRAGEERDDNNRGCNFKNMKHGRMLRKIKTWPESVSV